MDVFSHLTTLVVSRGERVKKEIYIDELATNDNFKTTVFQSIAEKIAHFILVKQR